MIYGISLVFSRAKLPFVILYICIYVMIIIWLGLYSQCKIAPAQFRVDFLGQFMCFEHPTEYPLTFVRECQMFIFHFVSRVETLDEKMREKNPLNFRLSPACIARVSA